MSQRQSCPTLQFISYAIAQPGCLVQKHSFAEFRTENAEDYLCRWSAGMKVDDDHLLSARLNSNVSGQLNFKCSCQALQHTTFYWELTPHWNKKLEKEMEIEIEKTKSCKECILCLSTTWGLGLGSS